MNLKDLHSVYFLGIGGIGMSAIARWFNHMGIAVSGYDKTPSPLIESLEKEGMPVGYVDDIEAIPESIKSSSSGVLVVWTPAIPKDSRQLAFFRQNGFVLKKRAEVLGIITQSMNTVAVAGTHGKTTTSSMVAHILKHAGKNTNAFLGGLTQNYQSNLILNETGEEGAITVVVEADEFDRSFLHLHPNIAIVTSVDADHLDIYGDPKHLTEGFEQFIGLVEAGGLLLIQKNALKKLNRDGFRDLKIVEYALGQGEVFAKNVVAGITSFRFDFVQGEEMIEGLELKMHGYHNVENALAAVAVVRYLGVGEEAIRSGISSYKGVKRRFEIRYQGADKVYIDDYAHHPEEIRAFLSSVKAMYPDKKLTAVFQPHLFTRTRDFAKEFSKSLSLADEVVLLDIYPARELPIPGVDAAMLLEDITSAKKSLLQKESLLEHLGKSGVEVLVTIGAGDIDRLVSPVDKWIRDEDK